MPCNVLFEKLISYGITGKFLKIIANLYKGSKTRIKLGNKMSQELENHKGVKHEGCILSPFLFNIFLSDLPKTLNNQVLKHENVGVNCLVLADDLLLLSESEGGLQSMLNHLSTYCKANPC